MPYLSSLGFLQCLGNFGAFQLSDVDVTNFLFPFFINCHLRSSFVKIPHRLHVYFWRVCIKILASFNPITLSLRIIG